MSRRCDGRGQSNGADCGSGDQSDSWWNGGDDSRVLRDRGGTDACEVGESSLDLLGRQLPRLGRNAMMAEVKFEAGQKQEMSELEWHCGSMGSQVLRQDGRTPGTWCVRLGRA